MCGPKATGPYSSIFDFILQIEGLFFPLAEQSTYKADEKRGEVDMVDVPCSGESIRVLSLYPCHTQLWLKASNNGDKASKLPWYIKWSRPKGNSPIP